MRGKPNKPENLKEEREERDEVLSSFIGRWAADATRVSIQKLNTSTNRYMHITSAPAELVNEEYIQKHERGGGGIYKLMLHDAEGRTLTTRFNIEIAPLSQSELEQLDWWQAQHQDKPAAALAPAQPAGFSMQDLLMRMEAASQRQHEEHLELIKGLTARREEAGGNSITELITALATLQNIMPKPQQSFPEKMMDRIFDMALKQPGAQSQTSEVLSFAKDVFTEMRPLLFKGATPDSAARPAEQVETAAAADGQQPAEEGDEVEEVNLTSAILYLKEQRRAMKKPEDVAIFIEMAIAQNPEFNSLIREMIALPFEQIIATDRELQMVSYRTWFKELYDALHVRLLGSPVHTGGPAGDGGNAQ
jgi:hypothetical protein